MLRIVLAICLLAGGCGRPLSENERAFTATLHGEALDMGRVRIVDGALIGDIRHSRPPRPSLTCRERILPPEVAPVIVTRTAAFVLFDTMFMSRRYYRDDLMEAYPERLTLARAMLLAHEMTHVWQWQNRAVTGYHPIRAAAEHSPRGDPYLFDLGERRGFLQFSYEQQGSLVEEYVCCRTLDPEGARTDRLRALLAPHFPGLARTTGPEVGTVLVPWGEAPIAGICS
ncbi:hypothetical protein [Mesobaculum littorinae]|uniref:hypothetical protein n=1 Tax=Mesobaculum littorinae TaxID=2486419 RepID=UPI0019D43CC0|nr:hypothetical protein [Mesobaculum littorinae]